MIIGPIVLMLDLSILTDSLILEFIKSTHQLSVASAAILRFTQTPKVSSTEKKETIRIQETGKSI